MKTYVSLFDSYNELITKAISGEANDNLSSSSLESRNGNLSFTGTRSWADCLSMINAGWPEGRDTVYRFTQEYGAIWAKFFPNKDYSDVLKPDITGSVPNIAAYIAGEPECMFEFFRDEEQERLIAGCKLQRIIICGNASAYIKAEVIYQFGSLIAALVNSMEMAGFSVELWIVWKSKRDNQQVEYFCPLKKFQERLDIDKLAFSLAHPSMLRRIIFSLIEQENDSVVNSFILSGLGGYGSPVNLDREEIMKFGTEGGGPAMIHGNMYFKFVDGNYNLEQLANNCTCVVKEHYKEVSFNDPGNPEKPSEPNLPKN